MPLPHSLRALSSPNYRRYYAGQAVSVVGTWVQSLALMWLAYRLSGSVPEVLAGSRLRLTPESLRLEVGKAARVPDSEVVNDRLKLPAAALGIKRYEGVEVVRD